MLPCSQNYLNLKEKFGIVMLRNYVVHSVYIPMDDLMKPATPG